MSSSGLWSWGAGGLASPGCPGTRPVRRDLEPVQTCWRGPVRGVGSVGGECACAVGECCRACRLVAASQQGSVMWDVCLGHAVYAVLWCLWDGRLGSVCGWLVPAVGDS